jgi:hypothetical protein
VGVAGPLAVLFCVAAQNPLRALDTCKDMLFTDYTDPVSPHSLILSGVLVGVTLGLMTLTPPRMHLSAA